MIDTAKERERLAALEGHTEGPWRLCAHLNGPEIDEGLWPVRYPREVELANARLIAAAPDLKRDYLAALDVIDAQAAEIERLKGERDALRIFIAEINNRWRHDWAQAVDEATDTLFKRMSAHAALSEREP